MKAKRNHHRKTRGSVENIFKIIILGMVLSICLLFLITDAKAFILSGNSINYNYNNPGSRASGMGGAFIGLADDATAAFTNPAGLSVLTKPEVALEVKNYTYTTRSYDQNATYTGGDISNFTSTTHSSDYDSTTWFLSFVSFTYPTEKFNFTIYRHQLVYSKNNFQRVSKYDGMPYYRLEGSELVYVDPDYYRVNTIDDRLEVATYGLSASYKVLRNLSLGASVAFDQEDSSYSSVTTYASGYEAMSRNTFFDHTAQAQHFILSLLWNPFSTFNIGMTYHYGPKFTYNTTVTTSSDSYTFQNKLKLPDFYGIGVSYSFPFGLTAAVDFEYILNSQLFKDSVFTNGTNEADIGNLYADEYKLDDTYVIRAGMEYVFHVKGMPLAIRGGYSYLPARRPYYEPHPDTKLPKTDQIFIKSGMGEDDWEDEHNFSLGFGAVLGKNFQIDLSGSWGTFRQGYSTSLVYRF